MLKSIQNLIQLSNSGFAKLNFQSKILAILIFIFVVPWQLLSILILMAIFPLLLIYCWGRFWGKKFLHQNPVVLFSPSAIPMNFLMAKAVRTQAWRADVFSYDRQRVFEAMSIGTTVNQSASVKIILYLTAFIPIFIWAVLKYDIFESPFTGGVLSLALLRKLEFILLKILAKKVVVYGYGSDCQIPSVMKKMSQYNAYMDFPDEPDLVQENYIRANIARANRYADVLFASYAKLGEKMLMIPIPAELTKWHYTPQKKKKIVTLLHSTNHRIYKGTRFIIQAVEALQKKGLPVKLILVEGKTIKDCYRLYLKSDIFIPHIIGGWYGSTPCEGMALGRPVICYLDRKIEKLYHYFARECPIVNANPDTLKEKITTLVGDFELRQKIGLRGVDFVHKYHSFEIAGKMRILVYEKIWRGEKINQKIFEKELKKRNII